MVEKYYGGGEKHESQQQQFLAIFGEADRKYGGKYMKANMEGAPLEIMGLTLPTILPLGGRGNNMSIKSSCQHGKRQQKAFSTYITSLALFLHLGMGYKYDDDERPYTERDCYSTVERREIVWKA